MFGSGPRTPSWRRETPRRRHHKTRGYGQWAQQRGLQKQFWPRWEEVVHVAKPETVPNAARRKPSRQDGDSMCGRPARRVDFVNRLYARAVTACFPNQGPRLAGQLHKQKTHCLIPNHDGYPKNSMGGRAGAPRWGCVCPGFGPCV